MNNNLSGRFRIEKCELTRLEKLLCGDFGEDVMDRFIMSYLERAHNREATLAKFAAVAAKGEFKKDLLLTQALDYASK